MFKLQKTLNFNLKIEDFTYDRERLVPETNQLFLTFGTPYATATLVVPQSCLHPPGLSLIHAGPEPRNGHLQ